MNAPELHLASEWVEGIEEVWITSESTVIHLSIDPQAGLVCGFSCRLQPGVVAEMGQCRDSLSGRVYPALCVFKEKDTQAVSWRRYCYKRAGEWQIES